MNLTTTQFQTISTFIQKNARPLDQALYSFYFQDGSRENVLDALRSYQNNDGGFGHGLEPDIRIPSSSAIATTVAIQYMEKLGTQPDNKMLMSATEYLVKSFSEKEQKWKPVPPNVNDYPHAPWWHVDQKTGNCMIDDAWDNPTVEILGYLHHYPNSLPKDMLQHLTQKAIDRLLSDESISEHSLYCYLRLYSHLEENVQNRIHPRLSERILETVNKNPEDWATKYVPMPLNFVKSPDSPFYKTMVSLIDQYLAVLVSAVDDQDAWFPTWQWGQYEHDWEKAKIEWAGKMAVENLVILKRFSEKPKYGAHIYLSDIDSLENPDLHGELLDIMIDEETYEELYPYLKKIRPSKGKVIDIYGDAHFHGEELLKLGKELSKINQTVKGKSPKAQLILNRLIVRVNQAIAENKWMNFLGD